MTSGSYLVQSGTISANLAGAAAALTKTSTTSVTLSGSNSYGGGTNVSQGSLVAATPLSLPSFSTSGAVSVANAATLVLDVGGAGQFQPADVTDVLQNATFSGNSFLGFDTTAAAGPYTVADNITLPNLGLTKVGSGTLILSGTNTHGGVTTVSAGTLQLGSAVAVQNSTVAVAVNNALAFSPGIGQFNLGGLSGGGAVSLQDTATAPS